MWEIIVQFFQVVCTKKSGWNNDVEDNMQKQRYYRIKIMNDFF